MKSTAALLTALIVLLPTPHALAKDFGVTSASIEASVLTDGSVQVTESLTYVFSGSFSGAFREIRLEDGQSISDISVSEEGRSYSPGASAELGSSGDPGTFGVAGLDDGVRIVWHYSAFNETRTFDVAYTFQNVADAYDDVVDVNMRVWGDEWDVSLGRLEAHMDLPGRAPGEVRVWGHPASVDGTTRLSEKGGGAFLQATNVPSHQWVEMRVVFPRRLLDDEPLNAVTHSGAGLQDILDEERSAAAAARREKERLQWLKANAGWLAILAALAAFLPAAGVSAWVWRRHGREPNVPPGPHHVMEPPGDEAPALVAALLEPGHERATGNAFAATLFDLIRRGHIEAYATTTQKKTWAGLKSDDVSDLSVRVTRKESDELLPFENDVLETMEQASEGSERLLLSDVKGIMKESPSYYAGKFSEFKAAVLKQITRLGWWVGSGFRPALIAALVAWAVAIGAVVLAVTTSNTTSSIFPWKIIVWGAVALIAGINGLLLVGFLWARRGWERRSQAAAEAASNWIGFRRFLHDFAGIKEAVPGSVEIWEQFLCYGIAFGIAERVLEAAQLHAPPDLGEQSSVYWISPHGGLGAGATAFAISDISTTISSVSTPSAGGGGGFSGGGFSGGGGGGFGGGGGGAW